MNLSRLVYFLYLWNFIDHIICTTMGLYLDSNCTNLIINDTVADDTRTWYTSSDGTTHYAGVYSISNINYKSLLLTDLTVGCTVEFFTGSFTACPLDIVYTFEPNACSVRGNASNYIFICSRESACASSISPSGAAATTEVLQISTTTTGAIGTTTTEAIGTGSSGSTSPTGDTQGSNTSDGSSKFSSPSAVAGYAITGLIVASIGVCIAWCQLRIAQKNRREKKIARSIQGTGL